MKTIKLFCLVVIMVVTGLASCTKDPAIPTGVVFTYEDSGDGGFGGNSGGGSGTNVSGSYNGHDYVDLGLPSGTLWATCNVGADSPEDYGNYYAWGETRTKTTYNWITYKYYNGSDGRLTKYCNSSNYGTNGFTDSLTTLQTSDDAATANWGNGWCMPTKSQWEELNNNTTVTRTTQNGVDGFNFAASNGKSLFLPATGYCDVSTQYYAGAAGNYLSSSLNIEYPFDAWSLMFAALSDHCFMHSHRRYFGYSVRAIRSASQN